MKKIIKIILYNFLTIFFIYLFIFSTKTVVANTYKIENIEVSDEYNTKFNKEDIINKAFQKGFKILLNKITISKDFEIIRNQNLKLIKSFVDSFSVVNEKFENNKYHGVFQINFNKNKILSFLRKKNIFHSRLNEKNILFIPVFVNLDDNSLLLFDDNPFYKSWHHEEDNQFLLKYVLHSEDLDDYKLIQERINFIENYDFNEIISKYELNDNYIILMILKDNNTFQTFSRFNVSSVKSNFKEEFQIFSFDEADKVRKLIKNMKIRYDDEWKKINLINTSIKLNITLNLNAKDVVLTEKIEKILTQIDLVEKYNISFFNNETITFSILSNSTPNKLSKEFEKYDIKFVSENNIWTLNE